MINYFRYFQTLIFIVILAFAASALAEEPFLRDARKGPGDQEIVKIKPWKVVDLNPEWRSMWLYPGDVDGDRVPEIIMGQCVNKRNPVEMHYTSAVAAQKLDGTILWTWGKAEKKNQKIHHDVACQVHDWDRDGDNEVILATEEFLVELDGKTGKEQRRFRIPKGMSDSFTFCNLTNNPRGDDIIVKDRYWNVYAYNYDGKQLWHSKMPGGYRTSHQAWPCDINGDGLDEVFIGFQMVNPDGSVRWTLKGTKANLKKGHCDCVRILKNGGDRPEDWRFAMSFCMADGIACIDGNGKIYWERNGEHFESIRIGDVRPDLPGPEMTSDICHTAKEDASVCFLGSGGEMLGRFMVKYSRHHEILDMNGDGTPEILEMSSAGIYDGHGNWIGQFETEPTETGLGDQLHIRYYGDMTGDGRPDIAFKNRANTKVYIYEIPGKGESGKNKSSVEGTKKPVPSGVGKNFTLY